MSRFTAADYPKAGPGKLRISFPSDDRQAGSSLRQTMRTVGSVVRLTTLILSAMAMPRTTIAATGWFTSTSRPAIESRLAEEIPFQGSSYDAAATDLDLTRAETAAREARIRPAESQPRPWQIAVAARTWFSRGEAAMTIAGTIGPPYCSEVRYVDILSELQWQQVDAVVAEFNADLLIHQRVVVQLSVGFGGASGGTFDDFDFCAPGRQELMSHTAHRLDDGDIRSFSIDVGYRYFESQRGSLELLLGHQHQSERFVAVDGVDLFPGSRTAGFQGRTVITQEYSWNSFRIGGRATWHVLPRLTMRGSGFVAPSTAFRLTDVHHLRDDLLQDPSIIAEASGGWSLSARAAVVYRLYNHVFLELGYQAFHNESGTGESTARTQSGSVVTPINAHMFRHGFSVGGRYEF